MVFWLKVILINGTELYQEYAEYLFPNDALTHQMVLRFDGDGKPVRDDSTAVTVPTNISAAGKTPIVPPVVEATTIIPITHPITSELVHSINKT